MPSSYYEEVEILRDTITRKDKLLQIAADMLSFEEAIMEERKKIADLIRSCTKGPGSTKALERFGAKV